MALALAVAIWAILTKQLLHVQSDGLQRVFASLYHWTPYTWGESRFGMLVPLLATPLSSPIANLLAQQLANTLFVFLFPFLLARWLLGPRGWLVAGALTGTLLLVTFPPGSISFVANSLVFPTAGVLGFGALLLFDRGRRPTDAAAWLLWALACWMTPSILVFAAPLVVLRRLFELDGEAPKRSFRELALRLAGLAAIAVALALTGKLVPIDDPTPLGLAPVATWPATWARLARSAFAAHSKPLLLGVALALAAAAALAKRPELGRPRALLALVAIAVPLELLAVGTLAWVELNERTTTMGWRYVTLGIYLTVAALPLVAGALAARMPEAARRRLAAGAAVALLATAAWRYGVPHPDRARRALQRCVHQNLHLDPVAHEILASGAGFVIGDYWKVFPVVFRVNSLLHERGEERIVWPLADRAEAAAARWAGTDWSRATIAALRDDPAVGWAAGHFALAPLVETGRGRHAVLYRSGRSSGSAPARVHSPSAP